VKTDKRDAVKLAHYLRSGDLTAVWVPDEQTEALRDLVRARDDAKIAEINARHRLSKFLLRHERRYPGKTAWTGMHFEWILVKALQALKGVPLITAAGVAVELGDLQRFRTARDLMGYVGLGVREDSTGKSRR